MTLRTARTAIQHTNAQRGQMRSTMYPITYTGSQMISGSMFGSAYLHEYRADEAHAYWIPEAKRIDFEAVLKALRSALSLRK